MSQALGCYSTVQKNRWLSCMIGAATYNHYTDVIMGTIASQITSLTIVYSTVYSDEDQRTYQSSALLVFVREIHRRPVNVTHKWPVTQKMFPFDDVIMMTVYERQDLADIFICVPMDYVHPCVGLLSRNLIHLALFHGDVEVWKRLPHALLVRGALVISLLLSWTGSWTSKRVFDRYNGAIMSVMAF